MGFGRTSLGGAAASGGGRSMGSGAQRPLSDINVTPLVDVMLVLLVIFIIAAPLMASAIKLELPRSGAGEALDAPAFVSVAVDARGQAFVDEQPLPDTEALTRRLRQAAQANPDTEMQLRVDARVPYARLVELMSAAHAAGLTRIGFVTQQAAPAPAQGAR